MTRQRSRLSNGGLTVRELRAHAGSLVAMAAITLALASVASATPLALDRMAASEVEYELGTLSTVRTDLVASVQGPLPLDDFTSGLEASLATRAERADEPLRGALGDPLFVSVGPTIEVDRPDLDFDDPITPIALHVAPSLEERVRFVEGRAPAPLEMIPDAVTADHPLDPEGPALEIAISSTSAELSEWSLGEARLAAMDAGSIPVRVVGIFEPIDTDDRLWQYAPMALAPFFARTHPDLGYTLIVTNAAYVHPRSWPALVIPRELQSPGWTVESAFDERPFLPPSIHDAMTSTYVIPFEPHGLTVAEIEELQPQLRRFLDASDTLPYTTEALGAMDSALARAATATVVVALIASGPVGVAVAMLWLVVQLGVQRRRDAIELLAARGSSGWALRRSAFLETLAITAPAAILALALAHVVIPGTWSVTSAVLASVTALAPAALAALGTSPQGLRARRSDLGGPGSGRARLTAELLLHLAAALAVWLLLQRGLTTAAARVGVDPLLAATPLLLALSAGALVLRVFPAPLHAAQRLAARGRGIVAFLGAARAVRDTRSRLVPVLSMIVGLAVTVFSGVTLTTVSAGIESEAHARTGAALRIESGPLDPETLEAIRATPGVSDAVGLSTESRVRGLTAGGPGTDSRVWVVFADTAALAEIQEGVPGAIRFDADMTTRVDGAIPVVLSPLLASEFELTDEATLAGQPVTLGGSSTPDQAIETSPSWVLVDEAHAADFGVANLVSRTVLVGIDDDSRAAPVARSLGELLGDGARVMTSEQEAERALSSPVTAGLRLLLIIATIGVALLSAASVVLSLVISAPARERLLALLSTLGLTRGQARGITAWELAPSIAISVLAGVALGVVLPWIVLAGVDLRPFTGGREQPPLAIDPAQLAGVVAGFVALVAIATLVAIIAARRVSAARALRTFEEG